MNQENNIILPSFYFSKKEYLHIFDINSLLTLNNFMNTRLKSDIAESTVYRIFMFGMYEFQKNIINSPDITLNIISSVLLKLNKPTDNKYVNKIYQLILNAKDIDDFKKINL